MSCSHYIFLACFLHVENLFLFCILIFVVFLSQFSWKVYLFFFNFTCRIVIKNCIVENKQSTVTNDFISTRGEYITLISTASNSELEIIITKYHVTSHYRSNTFCLRKLHSLILIHRNLYNFTSYFISVMKRQKVVFYQTYRFSQRWYYYKFQLAMRFSMIHRTFPSDQIQTLQKVATNQRERYSFMSFKNCNKIKNNCFCRLQKSTLIFVHVLILLWWFLNGNNVGFAFVSVRLYFYRRDRCNCMELHAELTNVMAWSDTRVHTGQYFYSTWRHATNS